MGRRKGKQGEEKRAIVKCKSIGQSIGQPNRLELLTEGSTALYSAIQRYTARYIALAPLIKPFWSPVTTSTCLLGAPAGPRCTF